MWSVESLDGSSHVGSYEMHMVCAADFSSLLCMSVFLLFRGIVAQPNTSNFED